MNNRYLLFILLFCSSTLIFAEYSKFKGFNFEAGSSEFARSLETKLTEDVEDHSEKSDQIILAHSQGGIRAMGYLTKMKNQGKLGNVDALVSIDSPITGFDGLDYGYSHLRSEVLSSVRTLRNGAKGIVSGIPGGLAYSVLNDVFDGLIPDIKEYNLVLDFFDDIPMGDLMKTVLNESSPSHKVKQITDMGRTGDFVNKYIQETRMYKKRVRNGYYYKLKYKRKSKKIWGRRYYYWVTYLAKVYKYKYVDVYYTGRKKYPTEFSNIGHIVGTQNDPFELVPDNSTKSDMKKYKNGMEYVYQTAYISNMAHCSFLFLSPYYYSKAKDCKKAASYVKNFKSEWGDLIGGRANDGFITESSQVLPGTPAKYVREVHLDHRTVGFDGVDLYNRSYDDSKKDAIYERNEGALDKILTSMGVDIP